MRHRERILRVAAETAEKNGLDPRNKEVIDSILLNKPLQVEVKLNDNLKSEEKSEEVVVSKEETPSKKKSPFPPKKKKTTETVETTTEITVE